MNESLAYFLLGLAFTIPMGILTNILTTRFQVWTSRRSKISTRKRKDQLIKELKRTTFYTENKNNLDVLSFNSIAWLIIYGILSLSLLGITILFTVSRISDPTSVPLLIASIVFAGLATFSFASFGMTIVIAFRHTDLLRDIANYDQYKRDIERRIGELERERPSE